MGAMDSEHSPTFTAAASTRGAAEVGTLTDEFAMRFSSTPRGKWGTAPRHGAPGKTVWAEVRCPLTGHSPTCEYPR